MLSLNVPKLPMQDVGGGRGGGGGKEEDELLDVPLNSPLITIKTIS